MLPRNSTAILTVGPRGAGKSTYCEKFVQRNQNIALVQRDKILIELFGQTYLNSYEGGHEYALKIMWERVANIVSNTKGDNLELILDCFSGSVDVRKKIVRKLRSFGFEKVVAWYFTTPEHICIEQYVKGKCGPSTNPNDARRCAENDYDVCMSHLQDMILTGEDLDNLYWDDWEGTSRFDFIVTINPLQTQEELVFV